MLSDDPGSGTVNAKDCYWYLYNSSTGEGFLSSQEDLVDEIFTRLAPSSGDFVVSPIQDDDSSPTYYRLSQPPSVGRHMVPPGSPVVDSLSDSEAALIPDRTSLKSLGNPTRSAAELLLAVAPGNAGSFRVQVFDVGGRRVTVLREGILAPGLHRIRWSGETSSGGHVSAGTYFVRVEGPGFRTTSKLVLVK
jgi:hypothetical protein